MVGSVDLSLISDEGTTVPERGVASLCVVPATLCQWYPHPGEAGHEEVGIEPSLPGLRPKHSSPVAMV